MTKKQKKYYAVARGNVPGIYRRWAGPGGAEEQVRGHSGARFKGFASLDEARRWMAEADPEKPAATNGQVKPPEPGPKPEVESQTTDITIYTDGGCRKNPGPGGYGAVILEGGRRRELSGGFRLTTNNRMELMACIVALNALERPSQVALYTDSRYVADGINRGWARNWRARGWMRTATEAARNADLWNELLRLCEYHRVRFIWVRGHAGNRENERCDRLASGSAGRNDLAEDTVYEEDIRQGRPGLPGMPANDETRG